MKKILFYVALAIFISKTSTSKVIWGLQPTDKRNNSEQFMSGKEVNTGQIPQKGRQSSWGSAQTAKWMTPMFKVPLNATEITGQIIAGSPAVLGQFPWQAALLLTKSNGNYLCGGSLIHRQWVLTAAHCTIGATSINVLLGIINKINTTGGVSMIVNLPASIITHPNYTSANLNNDLGLVKLPAPVALTANIKVIKIAAAPNTPLVVSGWGRTCNNCPSSTTLNYASVTPVTNAVCSSVYGPFVVTANTLCTKGTSDQSPCMGDSGGPLIQPGSPSLLVGVVSFVSSAGCQNSFGHPAGYVRPKNYCPWINGYIPGTC